MPFLLIIIILILVPSIILPILGFVGIYGTFIMITAIVLFALLLVYANLARIKEQKQVAEISAEALFFALVNNAGIPRDSLISPSNEIEKKLSQLWKNSGLPNETSCFFIAYDKGREDIHNAQESYLLKLDNEHKRFILFYYYIRYGFGPYKGFEFSAVQMQGRLGWPSGSAYRAMINRLGFDYKGDIYSGVEPLRQIYLSGNKEFVKIKPPYYSKWV